MINYQDTVVSQYAMSPIINALIETFNDAIDPSADIDSFYDMVFNLATAQGPGLLVWGRILGVGNVLQLPSTTYLGFKEAVDPAEDTFGFGQWYNGQNATTNYTLSDDNYRTLLYAKAAYNISDASIPSINRILMALFGSGGNCYCTDGRNMTMTYTFAFQLTPVQYAIVAQSGVLPRPDGVLATVVQGA